MSQNILKITANPLTSFSSIYDIWPDFIRFISYSNKIPLKWKTGENVLRQIPISVAADHVSGEWESGLLTYWIYLLAGLSHDQILDELPDLEMEDIEASIKYARGKIDHPIVAAWKFGLMHNSHLPFVRG